MPSGLEDSVENADAPTHLAESGTIRELAASDDDLPSHQNYLIRNVATGLVLDKAISAANTSILRPLSGKPSQLWNLGGNKGGTILTHEGQVMLIAKWDDANKLYSNKVVVADGSGGVDPAAGKWSITHDGFVQHDATGMMLAAESSNPAMMVPYQAILQTRSPSLEQQWQIIPLFEEV